MAPHDLHSDIPQLELPPGGFQSRIPDSLLVGKSPEEQFLFKEVGKMAAFAEWAAPLLIDNNRQARRTNGRLLAAEGDIREIKTSATTHADATAPLIKVYRLAGAAVRSKLFWVGAALFTLVILPWVVVNAPAPIVVFKAAATLLGIGS